jgi:SOS-response transcriptional repressor LexA
MTTTRTTQILQFLHTYHAAHGYAPTYREIADACGLASTSGVALPLMKLEKAGEITQARSGKGVALPRGIVIND